MPRGTQRILIIIILLFSVGAAVIYWVKFKPLFRYAGTLEATKVDLTARLAAMVTEVRVQEGEPVTKGQILVKFACEDFKVNAKLAQDNYRRNDQLTRDHFIAPTIVDNYRSARDEANIKVDWCTLVSPLDGKVLDRYHEPGEWLLPGSKILTLANVRDLWAYIYVPQPLVARLSLGMRVTGYLPELDDREFIGEIIKINAEAEFTPKNVQTQAERERLVYGIKIGFGAVNSSEILKPGMTIEVALPHE